MWCHRNIDENEKEKTTETRLIVAASDHDPDMLYATRFFVPDPFIFLEQNGKRTIVLSDLEIDRARKQARADEFVSLSQIEREVQGTQKKAPPFEKVMSHFLRKRGVRSRGCAREFSARLRERTGVAENSGRVRPTDFSGRNAKPNPRRNCKQMRRALAITEKRLARAMEVLTARNSAREKTHLVRTHPDLGNSAGGNRFGDLARRRIASEHDRRRRRSGVRSA